MSILDRLMEGRIVNNDLADTCVKIARQAVCYDARNVVMSTVDPLEARPKHRVIGVELPEIAALVSDHNGVLNAQLFLMDKRVVGPIGPIIVHNTRSWRGDIGKLAKWFGPVISRVCASDSTEVEDYATVDPDRRDKWRAKRGVYYMRRIVA